jgi:hypothetical protein
MLPSGLTSACREAAALTPDGRRLLVVADTLRIFDATAGDLTESFHPCA